MGILIPSSYGNHRNQVSLHQTSVDTSLFYNRVPRLLALLSFCNIVDRSVASSDSSSVSNSSPSTAV